MSEILNTNKCEVCGGIKSKTNKRFCSPNCRPIGLTKPMEKCLCVRCGTGFEKKPSDPKRFCTKLCAIYATGEKWKGKNRKKNTVPTKVGKGRSEVYETFY